MSFATDHLEDIHRQIEATFSAHPLIRVTPDHGQPPDSYLITYLLAGLSQTPQGEIVTVDEHRVELAIPFGFPHFPPNCKPKSPIFHPDFDPAAICLGDFWTHTPSLPELIIHLGKMINGELFTTGNAFNEQAASWYAEHRQRFPLAQLLWIRPAAGQPTPDETIDILEDADLHADLDYLSLEVDEDGDDDAAQEAVAQLDVDDAGAFSEAASLSPAIDPSPAAAATSSPTAPAEVPPPAANRQRQESGEERPKRRHRTLSSYQPPQAKPSSRRRSLWLALFLLPAITVAAGGGYLYVSQSRQLAAAETEIDRCRSLLAGGDFSAAESLCQSTRLTLEAIPFRQRQQVQNLLATVDRILQSEELRQGLQGKVLVDGTYVEREKLAFQQRLSAGLDEAQQLVSTGQWAAATAIYRDLLDQSRLHQDDQSLHDLQGKLDTALFHQTHATARKLHDERQWAAALAEIDAAAELLASGMVAEGDRHRPQLTALRQHCQLELAVAAADQLFAASSWSQAAEAYRAALAMVEEAASPPQTTIPPLQERLQRAELYSTVDRANLAFAGGRWEEAIAAYQQAADLLTSHQDLLAGTDSAASRRKIERIILQAAIIQERQSAASALQENNLSAARASYQRIIDAITGSGFTDEAEFHSTRVELTAAIEELTSRSYLAAREGHLREHFRDLFAAHYPTVNPDSLTNFQVKLARQSDTELLFRMQCTETGSGRPLTLVMFYHYDRVKETWRLHTEGGS